MIYSFMKTLHFLAVTVCLLFSTAFIALAQAPKGHLVIIGGGGMTKSIDKALINHSGGPDAKILVISTASGNPEEAAHSFISRMKKAGAKNLSWIAPTRAQANDPAYVKVLDGVTGIYFTGGQQHRITDTLRNSLLHKKLQKMYEDGAMIGGTSAGAAMMTEIMIKGGRVDGDTIGFKTISPNMVKTLDGMGFLKGAIVDQHFLKRARENRLFSIIFEHPECVGIGIDEATAIVVSNGKEIEVLGKSSVMVLEPDPSTIRVDERNNFAGEARLRIFFEGDRFQLK